MFWESHNPYFNRWFSAIKKISSECIAISSHNPYFNRWFSAIFIRFNEAGDFIRSQSLF